MDKNTKCEWQLNAVYNTYDRNDSDNSRGDVSGRNTNFKSNNASLNDNATQVVPNNENNRAPMQWWVKEKQQEHYSK